MKKIFCLAVLITFFAGNFFEIAQAKIETFEGSGAYPITDEKTHGEVKELAKKEAIRDALNKAGVAVFSKVTVKNNILTEDVIKVTAGNILKILDDKYKFIPVEEDDGIGMYKATVTVSIDTDELNVKLQDFLKKESTEQSTLASQYEELQKLNDANTKRIAELEKQLAEKNSAQNIQQIKNEVAEIDKNALYAQKIDEGWQAWNNNNFETALKFFDEAVNLKSDDYQGYYGRGTTYGDLKNYSQAIQDLNQAIKLNSNSAFAYNNLGNAYVNLKNYQQAISNYTQAIKLNSNFAKAYYNRGLAYADLQNYQQAITDYTQAIKLNPNDAMTYNNRGIAYKNFKNYEQAISDYTQAIKLNPKHFGAYNNRGVAYKYLQNYNQAIQDFTHAIKLNPNLYQAYSNRGEAYEQLGEIEKAKADYKKARELGWNG